MVTCGLLPMSPIVVFALCVSSSSRLALRCIDAASATRELKETLTLVNLALSSHLNMIASYIHHKHHRRSNKA